MKQRNHVVLAFIKRRPASGAHGKSFKAQRRAQKINIRKELA